MFDWRGFEFHELIQVPRPDGRADDERASAERGTNLTASLTGAHADLLASGSAGAALATAWVRQPGRQALRFLLAGRPFFPPAAGFPHGGTRAVLFPPGAVGADLPVGAAAELLGTFRYWTPCTARPDVLRSRPDKDRPAVPRQRGTFDRRVSHLNQPFAWLVLAEPLRAHELEPELRMLVNEILPLSRGEVGEAKRVELERKQARHRELSRAQHGNSWRIRVLVGSVDERGAATAAAMLCAAAELDRLPYTLAPVGPATPAPPWTANESFVADTDLLAALTRPPERELPGIRVVEPHSFDVTPEPPVPGGLRLGSVLDEGRVEVGELLLGRDTLNRHVFVCGATGGGKSQTVRHLLTEASRAGLPWLVIEPAKAEYRRMAARLAGLGHDIVVIRPGDPDCPPAGFNPLEPSPGFPLQTHLDLLRALFLAAFESHEPFPQILSTALTRSYTEQGWDLAVGEARGTGQSCYPTLGDLQRVAASVVSEIGYGPEVAADIHGFIQVRLGSLRLGTTGRMFEGGHPLDFGRLLKRNVILEIEDVGDDADKAFLMGAVLIRLTEHLRVAARRERVDGLIHLTVVEEAHRLLRRPEPGANGAAGHAVEMFAALLAEVRAYGEGLIIVEQIPSKLTPDVIKNTAAKIVHRLPAQDDRDSVGATMNLDDAQSRFVVTLTSGQAAVFTDGMDRPLLLRVPDGSAAEHATAPPAPLADLVGRRSSTCGTDCAAEACTLRQQRAAHRLLEEHPWLTLWAELTVLAHLTAQETPTLGPFHRARLEDLAVSPRTLDCAISHAVDDAVAVRARTLAPDARPADLADHCAKTMRALVAGRTGECAGDQMGYLADIHGWLRLLWELRDDAPGHPLPDIRSWERRFGRPIPGSTNAEWRVAANVLWSIARSDRDARDAVVFGTRTPSAVEGAIGTVRTDDRWRTRLAMALQPFGDLGWPLLHLLPEQDDVEEPGS